MRVRLQGERAQRLRTGGYAAVSQAGAGSFQHAKQDFNRRQYGEPNV
jgi:hypothetical protein